MRLPSPVLLARNNPRNGSRRFLVLEAKNQDRGRAMKEEAGEGRVCGLAEGESEVEGMRGRTPEGGTNSGRHKLNNRVD